MSQIIPIYIPTLISDINYNPAKVYPRLFFYNGKVECQPYYFEHKTASGSAAIQTTELDAFPYVDHYNVVTGSFPSADSKTLLFLNEEPVYGSAPSQSLYTEYWETYINLLYDPKTRLIGCSAIIPLADYYQMELNDLVEWRGNTYHLRAINDYDIKTGKCSLELLGPIIRDAQSQQINCNFTFVSSNVPTTTITPTSVPTTLVPTTLVPTTLAPTDYNIEYLMLAGGGGGGYSNNSPNYRAGGGGAGGYISGSRSVNTSDSFAVVIGTGGTAGKLNGGSPEIQATQGGNTTFNALTAIGGGRGGSNFTGIYLNGGDGGSGGGPATSGTVGVGTAGQGFNGRASASPYGGNGGGAGAAPTTDTTAGAGKAWLDGNVYGQGGPGTSANYSGGGAGYGAGGHGNANDSATDGVNGVVIIRYSGTPVGTGGTITQTGGYTYHTFTTNGTFAAGTPATTLTPTTLVPTTTGVPTTTLVPTTTNPANRYYVVQYYPCPTCAPQGGSQIGISSVALTNGYFYGYPGSGACYQVQTEVATTSWSVDMNYMTGFPSCNSYCST